MSCDQRRWVPACAGTTNALGVAFGGLTDIYAGTLRSTADRADQWRVLRHALARPGGDLRPAQHHQLHAWRALYDGSVLRVVSAAVPRPGLLVGAADRAARGRCVRRDHRTDDAFALVQARSPLRPTADLR